MLVYTLQSNTKLCWDYFSIRTVSTLFTYIVEFYSSSNMNIAEWLVSIPAVQLFLVWRPEDGATCK